HVPGIQGVQEPADERLVLFHAHSRILLSLDSRGAILSSAQDGAPRIQGSFSYCGGPPGVGITPSCWSMPIVLRFSRFSRILPSTMRKMLIPLTSTLRPVGGRLPPSITYSPVWVPRKVQRATTFSPSAN